MTAQVALFAPGAIGYCPACHRPIRPGQAIQPPLIEGAAAVHETCMPAPEPEKGGTQ